MNSETCPHESGGILFGGGGAFGWIVRLRGVVCGMGWDMDKVEGKGCVGASII